MTNLGNEIALYRFEEIYGKDGGYYLMIDDIMGRPEKLPIEYKSILQMLRSVCSQPFHIYYTDKKIRFGSETDAIICSQFLGL